MLNKLKNQNALFMVGEKALHTLINFAVLAILARALGPEVFGAFGLVQAVFIVGFHVALYFSEQTIIKFTLTDSGHINKLYQNIIQLKFLASLPIYCLSVAASYYFYGAEFATIAAVYCGMHLCNVDKLYLSYFRALEKGRLVFAARMSIYIPLAIVKIAVVVYYGDLVLLAATYTLEALLLGGLSYLLFRHAINTSSDDSNSQAINTVGSELGEAVGYKQLTQAAWPIFSSAVLITLYSRVDQFMIESMLGAKELGIYTTAVKVSEASTYIITTLIASRFPQLMRLKETNTNQFDQELVSLMRVAFIFALGSFVIFAIGAEYIVVWLFGADYITASGPLVVHIAGTLFIYYGVICTQYLIARDLEIYRLYRVMWGLIINIALNVYLIPRYGLMGAAASTLFSQALSAVAFNAISQKTKPIFRLQIQSFCFWKLDVSGKQ